MENQSLLSLGQADHEGGAVGSAGPASTPASFASSGASSGVGGNAAPSAPDVGGNAAPSVLDVGGNAAPSVLDVGGNAAPSALLSVIDSSTSSVSANGGAIASGGIETSLPLSFVQSATLGITTAGHAVDTLRARENFELQSAVSSFNFENCFSGNSYPAPVFGASNAQTSAMSAPALPGVLSAPTSQPIVPAPSQLPSGGPTSQSPESFATISAEQLVHRLRQRIQALDVEAWKALDFDGSTILELSSPASLPGHLTEYFGYNGLLRDRVALD